MALFTVSMAATR